MPYNATKFSFFELKRLPNIQNLQSLNSVYKKFVHKKQSHIQSALNGSKDCSFSIKILHKIP